MTKVHKLFDYVEPKYIDKFRGEYNFLSNFYKINLEIDGKIYPSSEHYYQSMKCVNEEDKEKIRLCETAGQSKREVLLYELRQDWADVKDEIMEKVLRIKFYNLVLRKKLFLTSEYKLREVNSWKDTYWGVDEKTMKGKNKLGEILMKIRSEINDKEFKY